MTKKIYNVLYLKKTLTKRVFDNAVTVFLKCLLFKNTLK